MLGVVGRRVAAMMIPQMTLAVRTHMCRWDRRICRMELGHRTHLHLLRRLRVAEEEGRPAMGAGGDRREAEMGVSRLMAAVVAVVVTLGVVTNRHGGRVQEAPALQVRPEAGILGEVRGVLDLGVILTTLWRSCLLGWLSFRSDRQSQAISVLSESWT